MTALRRRWFQISLRTLFVIVTACAIAAPLVGPVLVAKYREWTTPKETDPFELDDLFEDSPSPQAERP